MLSMNAKLSVATSQASANPVSQKLKKIESTYRKMSTGRLAPTAADSPSLLSREIRLMTKMRSSFMSRFNLNQSISLTQTADSHLGSLTDGLFRLRELSVAGMSETLTLDDRAILQTEADEILKTLKGEVGLAQFNGHSLFQGNFLQQATLGLAHGGISEQLLSLPNINFEDLITIPDNYSDQDIVIALDATGSMGAAIDALANELESFVNKMASDYIGDVRVSLVVYSDIKNSADPVGKAFEVLEFRELRDSSGKSNSENLDFFSNYLANLNDGGSVEDLKGVIEYIDDHFDFKEDANQQIVVIGSAGDEANDRAGAVSAAQDFVNGGEDRTVSTISVNGTSTYFRDQLSSAGGGSYLEFDVTESLSDQLIEAIASTREITSFNLMSSRKAKDGWFWTEHFFELIDTTRSSLAGFQKGLEHQIELRETDLVVGEGTRARATSADFADLSMQLSRNQTMLQSEVSIRGEMINTFGGALLDFVDSLA